MREPSDTTPNAGRETDTAECENCGATLDPLEWVTLEDDEGVNEPDDEPGFDDSLYFCDEDCLEAWKADQES